MDANQIAHYASIRKADAERRQNFEALYKKEYNVENMPTKPAKQAQMAVYVDKKQQKAWEKFQAFTDDHIRHAPNGLEWVWRDLSLYPKLIT